MAARALLVALCLAAAGLVSCGGGDSAQNAGRPGAGSAAKSALPRASALRPTVVTGGGGASAGPVLDPVLTRADRRCRSSVTPSLRTPEVDSLAARATQVRRDHARLRRISRALVSAIRGRVPSKLRRYRTAIEDQMFLDARIERAAKEGDALAVGIGLRQNRFNQRRRRQIADQLGLYACL
jgi:hypothetical protein